MTETKHILALHPMFNIGYTDFYSHDGLAKIHHAFESFAKQHGKCDHADLCALYKNTTPQNADADIDRNNNNDAIDAASWWDIYDHFANTPSGITQLQSNPKHHSLFLVAFAPIVEKFIGTLFNIQKDLDTAIHSAEKTKTINDAKRLFVQRFAMRQRNIELCENDQIFHATTLRMIDYMAQTKQQIEKEIPASKSAAEHPLLANLEAVKGDLLVLSQNEYDFSLYFLYWLEQKNEHKEALECASTWFQTLVKSDLPLCHRVKRILKTAGWTLLNEPGKLDFDNLVHAQKSTMDADHNVHYYHKNPTDLRYRDGFNHTDPDLSKHIAMDEAHYCIHCHKQEKDSCSHGLKDRKDPEKFQQNPLNSLLEGCPLEEKISEMNFLRTHGHIIGSLAVAMIDNPLLCATGHRICNDCMKGCIYQKQDPVNIPFIETQSLDQVLSLPFGFEIYFLLSRWNPLHISKPIMKKTTDKAVLIAGMGPAGFNTAHHLLMDGHHVVGIDGLKIEPLPEAWTGRKAFSNDFDASRIKPIQDVKSSCFMDLSKRVIGGFGGVMEYGITARWNKNYLTLIQIMLQRSPEFHLFGGTRLGSQIKAADALDMGFDHIALCTGAGKPRLLGIPGDLSKGIRMASDFLMTLQLGGAFQPNNPANLLVELPIIVIGGGLTAIDTATESKAYYIEQCKKYAQWLDQLSPEKQDDYWQNLSEHDQNRMKVIMDHGRLFTEIMHHSHLEDSKKNKQCQAIIDASGGVKLAYRRSLQASPSYRLNHEEIDKALEEGIQFIEYLSPQKVIADETGHVNALCFDQTDPTLQEDGQKNPTITLDARTILVAAGTTPNIMAVKDNDLPHRAKWDYMIPVTSDDLSDQKGTKNDDATQFFCYQHHDGKHISYLGDMHPHFAGNVVKAMASGKKAAPHITQSMQQTKKNGQFKDPNALIDHLYDQWSAIVEKVTILAPKIVEIVVHAPSAAKNFQPGQFYRLQNYAKHLDGTEHHETKALTALMEGLALTGAWVSKDGNKIGLIVLEMGGSSDFCRMLKPGTPVVLMGPTGTPTEVKENDQLILVGGGLGNAVLFSIGKMAREKGCKVVYFAGYRHADDRFHMDKIEEAADQVIWCADNTLPNKNRDQDMCFKGNMLEAMDAYKNSELGNRILSFEQTDRLIVIGSDGLMRAVQNYVHNSALSSCTADAHNKPQTASMFKKDLVSIGSINSPMQCMMKAICAQCLQKHIDPETGEEYVVYSCVNQDQDLKKVDFGHLRQRLMQNHPLELLCRLRISDWRS